MKSGLDAKPLFLQVDMLSELQFGVFSPFETTVHRSMEMANDWATFTAKARPNIWSSIYFPFLFQRESESGLEAVAVRPNFASQTWKKGVNSTSSQDTFTIHWTVSLALLFSNPSTLQSSKIVLSLT